MRIGQNFDISESLRKIYTRSLESGCVDLTAVSTCWVTKASFSTGGNGPLSTGDNIDSGNLEGAKCCMYNDEAQILDYRKRLCIPPSV